MEDTSEIKKTQEGFRPHDKKWVRWVLIGIGSLSVGLGILGIFLPLLPTTPFLLLAAACYFRSSERFYYWLLNHRWFGSYIRQYREGKPIPTKVKIFLILLFLCTLGISITIVFYPNAVSSIFEALSLNLSSSRTFL